MNTNAPHHQPVNERMVTPEQTMADQSVEQDTTLRPQTLDEFIGQDKLRENLRIFVDAARSRDESLDHVLLAGPPGLGKTTLAQIVAREMGVGFRATSGPVLSKAGDLAAILTNLQPKDVLFIDEIHRLNPAVEEILYPAMEDRELDLIIGEGPAARSVRIDLPPFTLVAATTRSGLITTPLRERFGIPLRLTYYATKDLTRIVQRNANLMDMTISEDGAAEIARRSRGTPRVAGRLTRRVRDVVEVTGIVNVSQEDADNALSRLDVDRQGLDAMDRRYLRIIIDHYGGGPVGIDTIAAALSEQRDVIEDVVEPYLLQQGFLQRTPRGRVVTSKAYDQLGLNPPSSPDDDRENYDSQDNLFNDG